MLFDYPLTPHERKHGPQGYRRPEDFKPWLRDEYTFRCVYCLIRERRYPNGQDAFSVDHLVPQVLAPSRRCDYSNLVYACSRCNALKGPAFPWPDPCLDAYGNHLRVHEDGTIEGLTDEGKRMIRILQLDDPQLTEVRQVTLDILRLAREVAAPQASRILRSELAFPIDLPNLARARPPGGNSKPGGADNCYYALRLKGILPETY